jgi:hypothetical protein
VEFDDRQNLKYAEISGVVIDRQYRDRLVMKKIFEQILAESAARGYDYIVGVSLLTIAREYRIIFKNLGKVLKIGLNFPWKQKECYNFTRMFPLSVKV